MNETDRMMAWAQIVLSVIVLVGTGLLTAYHLVTLAQYTKEQNEYFENSLDWAKAGCALILFFWFQRLRLSGIPDAGTVTTTRTDPDGSKTKTTMPALAAAPAVVIAPAIAPTPPPTAP